MVKFYLLKNIYSSKQFDMIYKKEAKYLKKHKNLVFQTFRWPLYWGFPYFSSKISIGEHYIFSPAAPINMPPRKNLLPIPDLPMQARVPTSNFSEISQGIPTVFGKKKLSFLMKVSGKFFTQLMMMKIFLRF